MHVFADITSNFSQQILLIKICSFIKTSIINSLQKQQNSGMDQIESMITDSKIDVIRKLIILSGKLE